VAGKGRISNLKKKPKSFGEGRGGEVRKIKTTLRGKKKRREWEERGGWGGQEKKN